MAAILEDRQQAIDRVETARAWVLANVGDEPMTFGDLIDSAEEHTGLDELSVLAAIWDLISGAKLELLTGSRVRRLHID